MISILLTDGRRANFRLENGEDGEKGDQGEKGDTGEQGIQGEPGLVWRGEFDENTRYSKGDAVSYKGSSYIARDSSIPEGVSPDWGASGWELLAEKGKDYVLTDADMTEIANKVIAALPVYDGSVV